MTPDIARVTRTREEARAAYDGMSRWYDLVSGRGEKKFVAEGLRLLDAHEGERVLEVGFGTGGALASLATAVGVAGKVSGIDISGGMAATAREKLERLGLAGRVDLVLGDAMCLPCETGSFDSVFMSFTLDLFDTPEMPVVLGECWRVLRAGGRICVVSMSALGRRGFMTRLYLWSHRRLPAFVDCRPIYARRETEDAGFRTLRQKVMSMWGLPVEVVVAEKD